MGTLFNGSGRPKERIPAIMELLKLAVAEIGPGYGKLRQLVSTIVYGNSEADVFYVEDDIVKSALKRQYLTVVGEPELSVKEIEFLMDLEKRWTEYPDLRLGQLLTNAS